MTKAKMLLEQVYAASGELMRAFSTAPENSLHSEITDFRQALKQLATFAERKGYIRLSDEARWNETTWFQKDYGETRFKPVTVPQRRVGTKFDRAIDNIKTSITGSNSDTPCVP